MNALCGSEPERVIVNTRNGATLPDLADSDIIETTCSIQNDRIETIQMAPLPEVVRGASARSEGLRARCY